MKRLVSLFAFALCFMFTAISAMGQNVNVNPGGGSYATLKAAFDAINAGTHTGAVTVDIIGNTTETSMAILNASGTGAANYTSVTITPSGGARTIAGSDTVTIKLAGADNVTIDGRIAGTGRNLSITNSNILTNATAIWLAHGGFATTDSAGSQNNIIRNCEISCGVSVGTATTNTNGILSSGTTRTTNGRNNDNNQYLQNRIIKARIGISLNGGGATNTNDNNLISENIIGPDSFGADNIGGTGIYVQFQNNCSITKNNIQYVGGLFANTTAGADRIGIGVGINSWTSSTTSTTTGSNYTVTGNIIHDVIEERTFSALGISIGVTLSGPKTNNLVANNVIYNVRANGTASDQGVGIGSSGGPGDRIVFNSISMTGDVDPAGTTTASTTPVAAGISIHRSAAPDTAAMFSDNSILVDVNSNTATLIKAAIIAPAVGYAWGSGGLNNNDYYIPNTGTNGNVTGVTGTTATPTYTTLANWQAAYTPAQDGASLQSDPIYNGNTSNLQPQGGSPLLNAGSPVSGITTDILGVTRNVSTPTVGAYENSGDFAGPSISYTALSNTTSTSNRSFTNIIITDPSGVNTSPGTKPRVYYKRSTDANTFNDNTSSSDGWKYAEANGASSPFDFTINYALLNGGTGVAISDVVQYFVVAQDLASTPNVSINSGTFAAQPSSVNLTSAAFPLTGSINSYLIVGPPMAGDYTVGVALFNSVSGRSIYFERVTKIVTVEDIEPSDAADRKSGEVETSTSFRIPGNKVMRSVEQISYVPMENGHKYDGPLCITRSQNPKLPNDAGVGVYATITAAVNDLNARGSSAAVRFLLLDASYTSETLPITVNYSTASSTNTLTILPSSGVTTSVSGAVASNVVFKILSSYVTIDGSNNGSSSRDMTISNTSTTSPSVVLFGSTGTTPVTNGTLKNCVVINGATTSTAVVISDAGTLGTAGYSNNIMIMNNNVQKAYIGCYAIAVVGAGNGSGNTYLMNDLTTSGANAIANVGLYMQGIDGGLIKQNEMANFDGTASQDDKGAWLATGTVNTVVERNSVHHLNYTGTGGYGGQGVAVSSGTANCNNSVQNNMLYQLSGDGWNYTSIPTDNPIGIMVFSAGQSGVGVYYNSIYMTGNTLNKTNAMSMGIFVGTGSVADIRDNSIRNDLGLLAALGYGTTCVWAQIDNTQFSGINYNNYYNNASGSGLKLIGQIAAATATDLTAWKGLTGQDVNSASGDPQYVSTTDLHVNTSVYSPLSNSGTPITGITNDYDGNSRSATTPDMGADEFNAPIFVSLNSRLEAIQLARRDTLTINLRSATTPYPIVQTMKVVYDSTNGMSSAPFTSAVAGTSYYLEIQHRNSISTWSANPILATAGAISYNFTTAQCQAYACNQALVNVVAEATVASFYSGDVTGDGCVDLSDITVIFNDAAVFVGGPYVITDLNFDEFVDLTDLGFAFNNSANFICSQAPPGPGPRPAPLKTMNEIKPELNKVNKTP